MQSRDLIRGSANRVRESTNAGPDTSTEDAILSGTWHGDGGEAILADSVTVTYLSALRWSLKAHIYISAQLNAQITDTKGDASDSSVKTTSAQTQLEHLQYILDAAFELCTVEKDHVRVYKTLSVVAEVLTLIRDKYVGLNSPSEGPVLYYQFKYFDFLGKWDIISCDPAYSHAFNFKNVSDLLFTILYSQLLPRSALTHKGTGESATSSHHLGINARAPLPWIRQ